MASAFLPQYTLTFVLGGETQQWLLEDWLSAQKMKEILKRRKCVPVLAKYKNRLEPIQTIEHGPVILPMSA